MNMKKILLFMTMMVGVLTAHADSYSYLTFETTDGAKASVSVASDVTLTISGGSISATTTGQIAYCSSTSNTTIFDGYGATDATVSSGSSVSLSSYTGGGGGPGRH